jgi:hypothetical protein
MRFSDMMGSGDEKSSKRPRTESETLIADALAPYLDAGSTNAAATPPVVPAALISMDDASELAEVAKVAEVVEVPEVPEVADAPVAPVRPFAAVAPVTPVAPVAPVTPVAPRDPIAATIADFAPISDDLLPRRR